MLGIHKRGQTKVGRLPSWAKASGGAGLLAAARLGVAAVAGGFASAPTAQAAVQANPVSTAMISAMTAGTSTRITSLAGGTTAALAAEKAAGGWSASPQPSR